MNKATLITCNSCNVIFNTKAEREEHAFRMHYEEATGLRRAKKWADLML